MQWWRRSAIAALSILLTSVGKGYALPTLVPGTTINIEPPPGFTISDHFSGLEHLESGSSLTINEFPAEAYTQMSMLFMTQEQATEAFLSQGIIVEDRTTIGVANTEIPLIYGTQQSSSGTIEKYIALVQGDSTVLLTFNIFDPNMTSREQVEAAIASIRLTSAPTLAEKVAQLPFSFAAAAPFELRDVLGGTSALLTTFDGIDPSGKQPMIVIAQGQHPIYDTDLAQISEILLRSTQGFSLAEITAQAPTSFIGDNGYVLEAEQDGISVIQYVHIGADLRHRRLVATGETGALNNLRAAVRSVAQSVRHND